MNGSQPKGLDGPPAQDRPLQDDDAERRVAQLTGMTPEAARAFIAYHTGLHTVTPRAA
jgi:hypothetical protein